MKIQTKYHGEIETDTQDIWVFEKGIPGFPNEKEFIILFFPENDVYTILQSAQTPELGFVIINPFQFFKDYSFDIDDSTLEQLQLENETEALVYSILTIQDPFEKTTTNLQAPIIMNSKNKKAKQMILNDANYHTKHIIFQKG